MTANKVLILDDDFDWQDRIGDHIEKMGMQVVAANNVAKAHAKVVGDTNNFLFAFIDVVLTEKGDDREGLVLLELLKKSSIDLPCILCSGNLDVELILDVMIDADYDWIVAFVDKQDFSKRPWRISKAIDKAKAKKQITSLERIITMATPTEQVGVGIILEGVKFLFTELGRRLEFWREKKGNFTTPKKVEIVEKKDFF